MASTYTLNNGIELIGTGEQSGTWGDTTNDNLQFIDTALDGQVTITATSAGTSGSPNTLPIADGQSLNSEGRNRMVIITSATDLGSTVYYQLTPNDAEKIIYIRNDLNAQDLILFQGTYNSSNDYVVPNGTTAVIYFDGNGSGAVAANVFNNAYFDSLRLGSVSVTAILDEDDMSSDSATALATQQSIKAYVDTQITAEDLDFAGDSGTGAVDLDSQTFTIAGTANEIETSASGQTLTIGLPDDVTIADSLTVNGAVDVNGATGFDIQTTNTNPIFERTDSEVKIATRHSGTTTTQYFTDTGGSLSLRADPTNALASTFFNITVDGSQALRIDSAQRTIVGGLTSVITTAGSTPTLQVLGSSFPESSMVLGRGALNANASGLNFVKSRNNNFGGNTILADNDQTMYIAAYGDDGTDYNTPMAVIVAEVDGTPGADDMPGRLRFLTTADGANSVTERMRINSSGNVGIGGGFDPTAPLDVRKGSTGTIAEFRGANTDLLHIDGDSDAITLDARNVSSLNFEMQGAEAMRINSGQRVLIGETSDQSVANGTGQLQVGTTDATMFSGLRYSTTASAPFIMLGKTRSGTVGTVGTIVQDDDTLGTIRFAGDDGADVNSWAAAIVAEVDGTPGINDMPGRLVFETTADGASSSTERMRINSSGYVGINTGGDPERRLDVRDTSRSLAQFMSTDTSSAQGPYITLNRSSSSPADNDYIGAIQFVGSNSAGEGIEYSRVGGYMQDVTDATEDGGLEFYTIGSGALETRIRIDGSGRLLVGGLSASQTVGGSIDAEIQLEGTSANNSAISAVRNSNDVNGPYFVFTKSRGSVAGAATATTENDYIGSMIFGGADGTSRTAMSAQIVGRVDGAVGTGDVPGRLEFWTAPDGSATPTERWRIDSSGNFVGNGGYISFNAWKSQDNQGTSGTSLNYWKLGTWSNVTGGDSCHIEIHATTSYSNGAGPAGTTVIDLRRDNSSVDDGALEGTFYSRTAGSNPAITSVYYKPIDSRTGFEIYVRAGSFAQIDPFIKVTGGSNFAVDTSNTGSTSPPSGSYNGSIYSTSYFYQGAGGDNSTWPSRVGFRSNGNIVIQGGSGIEFADAGGSGTATGNTLERYEEGTFSPRYSASTGGQIGGTQQGVGTYTRIGNTVNVRMYLFINNISVSGKSGSVSIINLPFAVVSSYFSSAKTTTTQSTATYGAFATAPTHAAVNTGTSSIALFKPLSGQAENKLQVSDFATASGNRNYVAFDITYQTS